MLFENIIGRGVKRAISISKTRKITASKKNRREKGIRAEFLGSNPHSKGVNFSRVLLLWRWFKHHAIKITARVRIMEINNVIDHKNIPFDLEWVFLA